MRLCLDKVVAMRGMSPKNIHYSILENTMLCSFQTLHSLRSDLLDGISSADEDGETAKAVMLSLAYHALCNIHFRGSHVDGFVKPANVVFLQYSNMLKDEKMFMRCLRNMAEEHSSLGQVLESHIDTDVASGAGLWVLSAMAGPLMHKLTPEISSVLTAFAEAKIRRPYNAAIRKAALRAVYYHLKDIDLSRLIAERIT